LHHKHSGRLAVGHTRKAIGHIVANPFLPADNGANTGGDRILDQRCRRKAESVDTPSRLSISATASPTCIDIPAFFSLCLQG
jgi:hypothetical protein